MKKNIIIGAINSCVFRFKNPKTKFGKYMKNLFVAHDQLLGAYIGKDPDETISSDTGKAVVGGYAGIIRKSLSKVLDYIDPGHCQEAIEIDEGKDELWK